MGRYLATALLLSSCSSPRWEQGQVVVEVLNAPDDAAAAAVSRATQTYQDVLPISLKIGSPGDVIVVWDPRTRREHPQDAGVTHLSWSPFTGAIGGAVIQLRTDIPWSSSDPCLESFDVEATALHELGHALGLNHSTVKESVMFPIIEPCSAKRNLDPSDVQALQELYE